MRLVRAGLVLALLILTTACSAPAAPPSTGVPPSGSVPLGSTGSEPSPVVIAKTLTFSEAAGSASEAVIGYDDGGVVAATAPDGTTFELQVPPGAVLEDTQIRMTPLIEVQGLGEGPVHAVRLEPEGLFFSDLARLTIEPSQPIELADQLLFDAAGDGSDPIPALVDPDSEPIVILVQHFSVLGAAKAHAHASWLQGRADSAYRELSRAVGAWVQAERQRRGGEAGSLADTVEALLANADRDILKPLREASLLTCDATRAYAQMLRALERQRELVGLSNEDTFAAMLEEIDRASTAAFKPCEQEAVERCREKPDPGILVKFWITWDRQRELENLGPLAPEGDPATLAAARCSSDLRIDRVVAWSGSGIGYEIRYSATKCGGPTGEWTIDSEGTLTGYGGTAQIGGPVVVTIGESLEGSVDGTANFRAAPGHPNPETQGRFAGKARYVEATEQLELTITSGSGSGYSYGFLDTGPVKPGTLTLPVEKGRFCQ